MTWKQLKVLILIVPNAPIITGTIFVVTFHIIIIIIMVYGLGKRENKELQDKNGNK